MSVCKIYIKYIYIYIYIYLLYIYFTYKLSISDINTEIESFVVKYIKFSCGRICATRARACTHTP